MLTAEASEDVAGVVLHWLEDHDLMRDTF
jgi:hypothetical protein